MQMGTVTDKVAGSSPSAQEDTVTRPSPRRPAQPRRTARIGAAAAALVLAGAGLAGCSPDSPGGSDGRPKVVAGTSVYGDIARAVAGDRARVDSLVTDANADPHSYEATPADAAKVSSADLVVYNGAGYDSFVDDALANAKDVRTVVGVDEFAKATGVTVQPHEHGGHEHGAHDHPGDHDHDHAGGGHDHAAPTTTDNEHVWFSLPTARAVAEAVAEQLAALDPDDAQAYRDDARAFGERITPLEQTMARLGEKAHAHYVQTEPVGAHLFASAGFHDVTPPGFLTAIEEDQDPAAADFVATRDLLTSREAAFLAFNTQTTTGVTDQLRSTADGAGVPVVELTETLPPGTDYVTWMTGQIASVEKAVDRGPAKVAAG